MRAVTTNWTKVIRSPFIECQIISNRNKARFDVPLSGSHLMAQQSAKVNEIKD